MIRIALLIAFLVGTLALHIVPHEAQAQITYQDLEKIAADFHVEYDIELANQNASFFINKPPNPSLPTFWWNRPDHRAAYSSYVDKETGHREHYIFFFSGFAELPGMTIDSAILTLCHELGHGLAGAPFKDKFAGEADISIEAMADDYAIRNCFPRMSRRIKEQSLIVRPFQKNNSVYVQRLCDAKMSTSQEQNYCRRVFRALEFDRTYYRTDPDIQESTSFEEKDPTIVSKVETKAAYYPPSQCRIDTMMAGLFSEPRPKCWWP